VTNLSESDTFLTGFPSNWIIMTINFNHSVLIHAYFDINSPSIQYLGFWKY